MAAVGGHYRPWSPFRAREAKSTKKSPFGDFFVIFATLAPLVHALRSLGRTDLRSHGKRIIQKVALLRLFGCPFAEFADFSSGSAAAGGPLRASSGCISGVEVQKFDPPLTFELPKLTLLRRHARVDVKALMLLSSSLWSRAPQQASSRRRWRRLRRTLAWPPLAAKARYFVHGFPGFQSKSSETLEIHAVLVVTTGCHSAALRSWS